MNLKLPVLAVLLWLGWLTDWGNAAPGMYVYPTLIQGDGPEVKIRAYEDLPIPICKNHYLSELGLKLEDLSWGETVKGVRMGAHLMTPLKSQEAKVGLITLVLSIHNQSSAPLMLPLLGCHPLFAYCAAGSSPTKILRQGNVGWSSAEPCHITLPAGKMITFTWSEQFDLFNKEHLPMFIKFAFQGRGMPPVPDSEKDLVVESGEFKFPDAAK